MIKMLKINRKNTNNGIREFNDPVGRNILAIGTRDVISVV